MKVGSLTDLARIADMPSYPSLCRFIKSFPDFPVIRQGQYGTPFVLDLEAAASFVREHWRDGRHERRLRRLAASDVALCADPSQLALPGLFDGNDKTVAGQ